MGEADMVVNTFSEEVGMGISIVPIHQPFLKNLFLFWIDFRLPKK